MTDETRSLHDAELSAVIASYLDAVDEGRSPHPAELLARHPHLAGELRAFLAAEQQLAQVAGPVRPSAADPRASTVTDGGTRENDPGDHLPPGTTFGDYRLLELIGVGGMGVVYRATDTALNREVAIKLLQERFGPHSGAARRFGDEAHITAQLQHPGIPPVHELGALPDGRPFLAMKLVRGHTLDQLLRERSAAGSDSGQFLAAFEQLCHAVAYAHAHCVIHRDLKPSNVMIGAFGEVQVMDWGLAKVLATGGTSAPEPFPDPTEVRVVLSACGADVLTSGGSVLGTPSYMPPEQAAGAVELLDARSDVFGLGGILCAILTGRPPFGGDTPEAVRQLAVRGDLGAAFARLAACGAERELIELCRHCLSANRDDRPADAGAVARAVAEFRADAERRARQAELDRVRAEGERARAELRTAEQRKRRRVQLALLAAVFLLGAGGGAFAWWQDRQERDQRLADERAASDLRVVAAERDSEARNKAEQARNGVATNLALATDLRKQYKFRAAAAVLAQAAQLAETGARELLPSVEEAQRDLAFVVQLDEIRYRKWVWIAEPGDTGSFSERAAPPEYRKAFAARDLDLVALDPPDAARRIAASGVKADLVAAVDDWALYESDPALRDRLLAVAREAAPGSWTDRLRDPAVRTSKSAIAKLAADADPNTAAPATVGVLAKLMRRARLDSSPLLSVARARHPTNFELAFAQGLLQMGRKDGQPLAPFEAARALRPDNYAVWINLGSALRDRGDVDGAVAAFKRAIELDQNLTTGHLNLGAVLCDVKRDYDGAIVAFERAIQLDQKSGTAFTSLGIARSRNGDETAALASWRKAVQVDPNATTAHVKIATRLLQQGDEEGALAAYRHVVRIKPDSYLGYLGEGSILYTRRDHDGAIAVWQKALARDPDAPAVVHEVLGTALREKGDWTGAVAAFKRVTQIDPKNARAHYNLGAALAGKGEPNAAVEALQASIDLDPKNAAAYTDLGALLCNVKRDYDGAIAAYEKAIALKRSDARLHFGLGVALRGKGRRDAAIVAFREAGRLDPKDYKAFSNLGVMLLEKGEVSGAIEAHRKAVDIEPKRADLHFNLGNTLAAKGELDEAVRSYQQALQINPKDAQGHYNLGITYFRQKKLPEAIASARAATGADPKLAEGHAFLGDMLRRSGDLSGARAALTEAARRDPRWVAMLKSLPPLPVAPPPRPVENGPK